MPVSIVLVPGSFTSPSFYEEIFQPLITKRYDIHAVDLKTVIPKGPDSPDPPLPTAHDDATAIAEVVTKLADQGKDVIVIAHSYGGTPASESIEGLSREARKSQGKEGGVVRLAYISALVPEVGKTAGSVSEGLDGGQVAFNVDVCTSPHHSWVPIYVLTLIIGKWLDVGA
jgi:pimeloyl-ACP methyl ester carboxylesterase